jgi:hypothetical protein
MNKDLRARLSKLEAVRPTELPHRIVGVCPLPKPRNGDVGYTREEIQRWLDAGMAQIAFNGQVILYNGGRTEEPTVEEWLREHAPAQARAKAGVENTGRKQ